MKRIVPDDQVDWSFTENPEIMSAIHSSASYYGSVWDVPVEDIEQHLSLWLAQRPSYQTVEPHLMPWTLRFAASSYGRKVNEVRKIEVQFDEEIDTDV